MIIGKLLKLVHISIKVIECKSFLKKSLAVSHILYGHLFKKKTKLPTEFYHLQEHQNMTCLGIN